MTTVYYLCQTHFCIFSVIDNNYLLLFSALNGEYLVPTILLSCIWRLANCILLYSLGLGAATKSNKSYLIVVEWQRNTMPMLIIVGCLVLIWCWCCIFIIIEQCTFRSSPIITVTHHSNISLNSMWFHLSFLCHFEMHSQKNIVLAHCGLRVIHHKHSIAEAATRTHCHLFEQWYFARIV